MCWRRSVKAETTSSKAEPTATRKPGSSCVDGDSRIHAQRVVSEIFDLGEILLTQPRMARVVPELGQDDIREHFIYSYRVIYEIQGEDLHMLAVIHGKQLQESVADRFLS